MVLLNLPTWVKRLRFLVLLVPLTLVGACEKAWNNPYVESDQQGAQSTLYTAFTGRPKHLDPALSYTSDEADFTAPIYEPLFQYHYLKRPYTLEPLTAQAMPQPVYLDAQGKVLNENSPADTVHTSVYTLRLKPGVMYQPHPAFAKNEQGKLLYHALGKEAANYTSPLEFEHQATRELTADDYVYEIKRLASSRFVSPIFGHMSAYIQGLPALAQALQAHDKDLKAQIQKKKAQGLAAPTQLPWLDLRKFDLPGARALDAHTLEIRINGKYPQFLYWLAMPFFAPIPWEADAFYSQAGFAENNLNLDWWPVGTGAYMLTENNPNSRMVLSRNPNFRGEAYPSEGEEGDAARGLLADAGKTMPFIDRAVFTLEKEAIPYWNKFLQGYYDSSGVNSDTFDQAVRSFGDGGSAVTPKMAQQGIRLERSLAPSIYYLGFNWLDPLVGQGAGGQDSVRARKLRQAIAIAMDWEEYSEIFTNGRAVPAHGPVIPGLFGHEEGVPGFNTQVYRVQSGKPVRKPIDEAFKLLEQAGYPKGMNPKTGRPLRLALDTTGGGPGDKARFDWYRKQFAKLNLELEIRPTDWNRYQDKVKKGNTQLFFMGWNADYPDPENFLFLLYGPNSRAKTSGENASNYVNPKFDALFEQMKTMPNTPQRAAVIAEMTDLVQEDVPWLFAYYPQQFGLIHSWLGNVKPNELARNSLKYKTIDTNLRTKLRAQWNQPNAWPLLGLLGLFVLACLPAWVAWRRREKALALRTDLKALGTGGKP